MNKNKNKKSPIYNNNDTSFWASLWELDKYHYDNFSMVIIMLTVSEYH